MDNITAIGGGRALFRAADNAYGNELWVSDGTNGGTYRLTDIDSGDSGSFPSDITVLDADTFLFTASGPAYGRELWVTDGTAAGTSLLSDILPGSGTSYPASLTALGNGLAVFAANDGSGDGAELWVTDGTAAGTSLLLDIQAGAGDSDPDQITALGNGKALFVAETAADGRELWVTDGTTAGTYLLRDITDDDINSSIYGIRTVVNGRAMFSADDGVNGYELWTTDGTIAGTSLLKNLNTTPVPADSNPQKLTALGNGSAIFVARDNTHGYELWITDGSSAGTSLLADITPGGDATYFNNLTTLVTGTALFRAEDDSHGVELWITDGTTAGTSLLLDINPGLPDSDGVGFPPDIEALGNGLAVFSADDGTNGSELWVTDGTTAGTSMIQDIVAGSGDSGPHYFFAIGGGIALFRANDVTNGSELWVTDGSATGTSLLKDINSGGGSSGTHHFVSIDSNTIVFNADDGTNGNELWVTDGTTAGTSLLVDINAAGSSAPSQFSAMGDGTALFAAFTAATGYELWKTDGTAAGTSMVLEIAAGGVSGMQGGDGPVVVAPGLAVFRANNGTNGNELWVTDGTAAGTSMLGDINPGVYSSLPTYMTALGNGLAVLRATNGVDGAELWVTDGTEAGTSLLMDINAGPDDSAPSDFRLLETGKVLFSAYDPVNGKEVWITDGTVAGTSLFKDIRTEDASSYPGNFAAVCFAAGTRIATPAGSVPVEHLRPGDAVLTLSGAERPIRWVGHRAIDINRHPDPAQVRPIRVLADAFAPGVPARDLRLSPAHAVLLDGVLVPVELLINHTTIIQEIACPFVTYFHIELDTHDVLLAEGLAAESYLDTGNRSFFANNGGAVDLHPTLLGQDRTVASCAPFAVDPATVEPLWRRLADRAAALGHAPAVGGATTLEPDLHIMVGNRRLQPTSREQGRYVFMLPATDQPVQLVSRAAVPTETRPWIADRRLLGVLVARITSRDGTGAVTPIPLDHPSLVDGWWAAEWHDAGTLRRWTNGRATLSIPTHGASVLAIEITATLDYAVAPDAVAERLAA